MSRLKEGVKPIADDYTSRLPLRDTVKIALAIQWEYKDNPSGAAAARRGAEIANSTCAIRIEWPTDVELAQWSVNNLPY